MTGGRAPVIVTGYERFPWRDTVEAPLVAAWRGVPAQLADPRSTLSLTRRLLALRRASPALSAGRYRPLDGADVPDDCFVYLREGDSERMLVALNFANGERLLRLPDDAGEMLVTTHLDRDASIESRSLPLRAAEGCVIRQR